MRLIINRGQNFADALENLAKYLRTKEKEYGILKSDVDVNVDFSYLDEKEEYMSRMNKPFNLNRFFKFEDGKIIDVYPQLEEKAKYLCLKYMRYDLDKLAEYYAQSTNHEQEMTVLNAMKALLKAGKIKWDFVKVCLPDRYSLLQLKVRPTIEPDNLLLFKSVSMYWDGFSFEDLDYKSWMSIYIGYLETNFNLNARNAENFYLNLSESEKKELGIVEN